MVELESHSQTLNSRGIHRYAFPLISPVYSTSEISGPSTAKNLVTRTRTLVTYGVGLWMLDLDDG